MTSKLLTYPLAIMILASVISGLYTTTNLSSQLSVGQSLTVNILGYNVTFVLGTEGILLLIIVISGLGVVIGISILGTGISTMAQAIIYKATFFYSLWGVFSVLSMNAILSIPIIGSVFWLVLTLLYSVGVQEQIGTHPS